MSEQGGMKYTDRWAGPPVSEEVEALATAMMGSSERGPYTIDQYAQRISDRLAEAGYEIRRKPEPGDLPADWPGRIFG